MVDSINGTQIGDDLPFANFEAGSIARVSGHVTDASGTRLPIIRACFLQWYMTVKVSSPV